MNLNDDVKKGFFIALGAVVALYVFGYATGVLKRIV
jgi:hypothetical protein